MRFLSILTLSALAACQTPRLELGEIVDELAAQDVVFLGEEHDNEVGHFQHAALLRSIHERRDAVVLSMEMFERDVQHVLDRYLGGEIDEATFLAESRPWSNYETDYRPMVEYAKQHGLPVIAANAPHEAVRAFMRAETDATDGMEHVAASTTAPRDAYWHRFVEAMGEHSGLDETKMANFYRAQCLRDDTMAESVVRALDANPGAIVIHVCGKFHAERGLGTVERVAARRPGVRYKVLTMESGPMVRRGGDADYTLLVPAAHPETPSDDEADESDEAEGS